MQPPSNKADVLGVRIDRYSLHETLDWIDRALSGERRVVIAHVHVTGMNLAYEQPWLRGFLNQADLLYCDGMGVKLGARLLGQDIPERYTLADWVWPLAERLNNQKASLYLLGNEPGLAEKAGLVLQDRYPSLRVAGAQHGFFDKTPGSLENEEVLAQINAARPDLLMVGMGMPIQEKWLMEHWPRLNVKIGFTVGGLFGYITGDHRRGVKCMTSHYLEWAARLWLEPKRYARRYLRDNPLFLARILIHRATSAKRSESSATLRE
jgi:N-acetylglucosaminyldiphosphoundecaprenol N-acetyl-beta-D-mannosaminyltransferase